ncbi:MAG: flagellar basal body P-ring formation protein FlgA [Gammaproteobacteria bacterium]|nr:flagellar basal body P-ring formation protein FlgA [Gammaproteobacteria bacterium]
MKKHNTIVVSALAFWSGLVHASPYQPLGSITQSVREYFDAQPVKPSVSRQEYRIGSLDPRLQLSACANPLTSKLAPGNPGGSNLTVAVSCSTPKNWTVYVPVRVARYMPVLVSRGASARGTRLSAGDLEIREVDVAGLRGVPLDTATPYAGAQLKRNLQAEQPLTTDDICLICKGELITIAARGPRLTVKIPGIATADANLGQRVMVRNQSSQRVVQARVTGPAEVEIAL